MSNLIKINDVELSPIEYRGERVVTLAMMDAAHKRADGTARRNFNEHRARLVAGEDYHDLNQADEIRTLGFTRPQGGTPAQVVLLTETGYSMLVKSFTDDLAWDVQRQLVKSYFKPAQAAATKQARRAPQGTLADARAIDFIGNMIAKVPGARVDVVAAIKLRMIEDRTGLPATQFRGALPAEAIDKGVKLNPTEIGKRLAPVVRPAEVNKVLIRLGLQRKAENGYVLTPAGARHGESRPFQAQNQHVGDQISWYESVVALVAEEVSRAAEGASHA